MNRMEAYNIVKFGGVGYITEKACMAHGVVYDSLVKLDMIEEIMNSFEGTDGMVYKR